MRIIFKTTSSNKYSINTLTKAIEEFDLDIYFENELNKIISLCDRSSVVVFSFMDMNSKKEIEDAIKIKKLKPQTKIIGGGAFFSNKTNIFPFDHIFISEGELSIREFLKGNIYEYKYIPKNFISLDEFGSISQKYKRFGSIEITRGCSYGCKYCQTPIIFGRKMRHKSIDKIIEEVEILLKNNFTDIRFITPDLASYGTNQKHDFTNLKKLVDALKKTIKGKGRIFLGSFPSEIRPEKVTNELAELLKSITSSKTIIIGAQSGSPKILEKINRGHSVEDIINATATLAFYGFKVDIDFMFGFPFETDEDEKYTKELIELLVSKYNSRIHIHYFMPLPGTPFEFLKPKPLSNSMRKYLSGLTSKKIAYGQWENQIGQKS